MNLGDGMDIEWDEIFKGYEPRKPPTEAQLLLETIYESGKWAEFVRDSRTQGKLTNEVQTAFHLFWIERGHFMRSRLNDDELLLRILKALLPPLKVESGLWLYRGENLDCYQAGVIGFCWTAQEEKALPFARSFNSFGSGGVLLKAWVPASSILAGIHPHSTYLGEDEITVNKFEIEQVQALQTFPPTH